MEGIEFGTHMVKCADATCIKLDYIAKVYFNHSMLLVMLSLTVVLSLLLTNVIGRASHDKEDVQEGVKTLLFCTCCGLA